MIHRLARRQPRDWRQHAVGIGGEHRLGLAARLRLDQRRDDVVRLSRVLASHEHEIAVADVRIDHRVAPHAERKDVLAAPRQRCGGDRHFALPILLGEERRAGLNVIRGDFTPSLPGAVVAAQPSSALQLPLYGKIAAGTPKRADVKTIANCGACHKGAESGDYGKAGLQVPGGRAR